MEYLCHLWTSQTGDNGALQRVRRLLCTRSRLVTKERHDYWEKLNTRRQCSLQRKWERHSTIHKWKTTGRKSAILAIHSWNLDPAVAVKGDKPQCSSTPPGLQTTPSPFRRRAAASFVHCTGLTACVSRCSLRAEVPAQEVQEDTVSTDFNQT